MKTYYTRKLKERFDFNYVTDDFVLAIHDCEEANTIVIDFTRINSEEFDQIIIKDLATIDIILINLFDIIDDLDEILNEIFK